MMGDAQQRSAQRSSLGSSEYVFEPLLRHPPQADGLPPFGLAFRSQRDVAPSTIHCALAQDNQSVALKRPQIVTECGTIDRQSIREFSKCRWVRRPMRELRQDCKLGRPQPAGLERSIIKLRQPSRCHAQRRRVARADAKICLAIDCHRRGKNRVYAHMVQRG
jgi:hypothetical protein